jgi:molecular chaperone DnaK
MLRWPDARGVKPVLFEGSPLLPSAVFGPAEGHLVVGSDALHRGRFDPARLEPNPKRHIDDEAVLLGDREVAVVDVIAAVLRHVTDEVMRVAGSVRPNTAVSYPAGWGPVRQGVLKDAAAAAGLGDIVLVPEPTAATDYFTRVMRRDVPTRKALVVYDLGAGTFDTSVVRRSDGGFETAAFDGINDIGGLDIDAMIVEWLHDRYGTRRPDAWGRLVNPITSDDIRDRRTLWDDVRIAKEMLSRAPAVDLRLF